MEMEKCTKCGFVEVKGEFLFHSIDEVMICDECYDVDPPQKCTDCKYQSYDDDTFIEDRNGYCICVNCCESGKHDDLNKFYMCGR